MFASLLDDEIREKRARAYGPNYSRYYFKHFYEVKVEVPALPPEVINEVEAVVADCIVSLADREDLFERTVRRALASICMNDVTGGGVCKGALDDLVDHQVIVPFSEIEAKLRQVTMDDVRQALCYLSPERRWILLIHP